MPQTKVLTADNFLGFLKDDCIRKELAEIVGPLVALTVDVILKTHKITLKTTPILLYYVMR